MTALPESSASSPVVSHLSDQHRFVLTVGGDRVGRLDYDIDGAGVWQLTHTAVRPDARGRGLAGHLVAGVLAQARRDGVSVHPVCPYVVTWLTRHSQWSDIVV